MAIDTDIAIDGSGNIYYTGNAHGVAGAGYYSVIELHRYLMDLADDAVASGDDLVDITSDTPSDRSTDNIITLLAGYRLDDANGSATDAISEHLYDGSIIQNDDGSIWDGLVVIASEGMDLQIIQNGALVSNDFWNTVPSGETLKGLNRDVANGISHRFMIKVNNAGTEIDGRRMVGITREFGKTYSEFKINGTARGNNVMALTYADDLNNAKTLGTIAGYTDVTNGSEGYIGIDVNNDTTNEFYYSSWTKGSREINDLYERLKWATEAASGTTASTAAATLYGLDGNIFRGITHQVDYGSLAGGNFVEASSVTFANGATAQILADNNVDTFWVQVLTGTIPTSGGITQGGVTATVTGSTEKTVSAPFAGLSTGSALIGAYGLGLVIGSLSAADKLTALDGITYTPPNNVTFSVNGIVSGEDRVLVGPESGGALQTNQFQTSGAITSGATSIVLATNAETAGTGSNSTDTPNTGHIRILDTDGVYQSVSYTGRTMGSGTITFTGCANMGQNANAGANAYVAYIDVLASASTETFTSVYSANRPLYIRVRDGGTAGDNEGIKTFETTGTLGTAGGSTTAIRTSDV